METYHVNSFDLIKEAQQEDLEIDPRLFENISKQEAKERMIVYIYRLLYEADGIHSCEARAMIKKILTVLGILVHF